MREASLAEEYRAHWLSEDKQGKLEIDDEREGFVPNGPSITKNENGQLFVVMFYMALSKLGILTGTDRENFIEMMRLCEKKPGLFYRRQNDTGIRQSHDNIVALVIGSLIFETKHKRDIAYYGVENGWCFSVDKYDWDIKSCLQGGDIALVKLCAYWIPTVWEMLWLFCGLCVVPKDDGQLNLASLRVDGLRLLLKYKFPNWVLYSLRACIFFFDLRYRNRKYQAIKNYFSRESGPQNPFIKLCEGL